VLSATPEAAKLSNDFLGNRGNLPWPVSNGVVIQGFGVYYTEGIKNMNSGIDIRTGSGAAVRAVFEGEVNKVIDMGGTYLIIIRHGEYFTAYSNLRSANVSKGQKVSTRQTIGAAATDPATSETSVHFDLYKGMTAVNPKIWLAAQ
jgi:murein DD-endopeptidase MepM/ murein hydrolase activator NlpD